MNSQFLTASVNEFIQVWALGGNASLNLTTSNGQATVGFNCSLGLPGAPHSRPPSPPSTQRQPRHRGPTENERNRQRAACHQAARAAASLLSSTPPTAPVTTPNSPTPVPTVKGLISAGPDSSASSVRTFKCNHCELIFKTRKGLKIHVGREHNPHPESESTVTSPESVNTSAVFTLPVTKSPVIETVKRIHCNECDIVFNKNEYVCSHIVKDNLPPPPCESCSKAMIYTKSRLEANMSLLHFYTCSCNLYRCCRPSLPVA